MTQSPTIWRPYGEYLKTRIVDFAGRSEIDPEDWLSLLHKSTQDIEWFWTSFLEFADFQWSKPYHTLLDKSKGFAWTDWFVGGKTNIAYNCLDWHLNKIEIPKQSVRKKAGAKQKALLWENESGQSSSLTYEELHDLSGKLATFLNNIGIKSGDAVGLYMPMVPEVLVILFACFKIGAIVVPVFSGFGAEALERRMEDASVKLIFTADGGKRRGKILPIKKDVDQIRDQIKSLKHVVVLSYSGNQIDWYAQKDCPSSIAECSHKAPGDIWFNEAIEGLQASQTNYQLEANHPCLYLYTSGTTGKPKGTIHTHAGALAQIAKELGFVFNVQPGDKFFWLTDIGWMMGPWEMIGVLFWGGTLIMYDGAPDYQQPDRLWHMIDKYQVNTLGISPTAIRILRPESENKIAKHDLSSLKYLGSTGEPWDEENYMWFFKNIGATKCPVMNISGGTELIGCLLTPLPNMPLSACSLGSNGLAMDVDVYDEDGNSLINKIGHLVLKQPAPSLTRSFLRDDKRYLDTYFSRFKNIWYHGDWAMVNDEGHWFLYGRSDDTIKVSGKRLGPGEIESILLEHPLVKEAAVIGIPDKLKGEAIVVFIVPKTAAEKDEKLKLELSSLLITKFGAVARPQELCFLSSLPKTRSGKIVRGAIKKKYLGEEAFDISSIENPDSLQYIRKLI